jgi:hypothetical protein
LDKTLQTSIEQNKPSKELQNLKTTMKGLKHTQNVLTCIKNHYLRPDINSRLDSEYGLMILIWATNPSRFQTRLEMDIRGQTRVTFGDDDKGLEHSRIPVDSALFETAVDSVVGESSALSGANMSALSQGASVDVVGPQAATDPIMVRRGPATFTIEIGEVKSSGRNIPHGRNQLTLRLNVVKRYLEITGIADPSVDNFELLGRIIVPFNARKVPNGDDTIGNVTFLYARSSIRAGDAGSTCGSGSAEDQTMSG